MSNPKIEKKRQPAKYVISRDILLKSNDSIIKDSLVDKTWWSIDQQIVEYSFKLNPKPDRIFSDLKNFKRSKAIRVFVSSTFTDFFNERELLVKFVFPELREWCNNRNMDLIECDLRWGVPADSTNEETILTCLSELDRCLDENDGQPFFIGMIGEKYGWIPDWNLIPENLKKTYGWIPDISITHMEIFHGSIRCKNKNACFFIRDPLEDIPREYEDKFFEVNSESKSQLKALKKKLCQYFPDQVFKYSCEYDKIDDTTGRKKVKLKNFKNFSEKALGFLIASIQNTYPNLNPIYTMENTALDSREIRKEKLDIFFQDGRLEFKIKRIFFCNLLKLELSYQNLFIVEMTKLFVGYDCELNYFLQDVENYGSGLIIGERGLGSL